MKLKINGKIIELDADSVAKIKEEGTEEIEVKTDFIIRTTEEEQSFKNNLVAESKKAGLEMAVKEFRTTTGLEFEGKNLESLAEAVKLKAIEEAKIEPNDKIKALQKDIETLKTTNQTVIGERDYIKNEFNQFKNTSAIESDLFKVIPDKTIIPKADVLTVLKTKYQFDVEDGKTVVKSNGEILKDANLNPIPVSDVITKFFDENPTYIQGAQGGAGGIDSGSGGSKMTVEAFIEKKAKEGVSHTDPAFISELEKLQKDGLIEV